MSTNKPIFGNLESLLKREINTYERYLSVISEQRKCITRFHAERLQELDKKRKELIKIIEKFHEERVAFLAFPDFDGEQRLSVLIKQHGTPEEQKRLLPLTEKLREVIEIARNETGEFRGVQSFALNVVNGTLSMLMRATKSVSKQYGKEGKLNESYLPASSRKEGVIKQA
ncbi:hypothetical protein EBR25_01040 [bacterium]|nr:hypothetical protein [bacterium]